MRKSNAILLLLLFISVMSARAASLFVEAESFQQKGGWVVDQQFMDLMGSSYLLAHGLGKTVNDATTSITFPEKGTYYVFVRTYNWTSPWHKGEGPGRFTLLVGNKRLATDLGTQGTEWMWQSAGKVSVKEGEQKLTLRDLTGFDGRCDAIYFTTDERDVPPSDLKQLSSFRRKALGLPDQPQDAGSYDLVVVGGGVAGISAAVSAARLGCKVALIHDRPVLGGNNSSEIRVHLGGRIEAGPYKELGNLQKEFGPEKGGNAQPGDYYEDAKKWEVVTNEKNISLFSNFRAFGVTMDGGAIQSIQAKHIETGEELSFSAPVFSDCTGDGTIGYLGGADYAMGRESKEEFGEETAPEVADKMTMGSSVQWYSVDKKEPAGFPSFSYGLTFNDQNYEKVTMGEWTWETGMNFDQIKDFERIRDYGLLVVYSNWSYLKNNLKENNMYKNLELEWVAYVAGKRESRRLLGDYILKEDDLRKNVVHEDGTASTTWTIDLHYPDPKNTANFPEKEFKSIAKHTPIYPYPIPYRCLYSRNIDNLFMAGRNISVTHVALGTVRVMRTTGMMGEVVGMAASLCKKYDATPRDIYRYHLKELKLLMKEGVGKKGLSNNQQYNEGGTLKEKPIMK
ncbi:FAD-dependent oxidoreductase [Parabacteroides sp. Marseille-P3160]|uniref:FAD-dependent oxidoreductase n=1 Tax=Parabacteroides sp. Marseille-P3160 TaxID=1917887 RepID=UPI0009B96981|nr:FAD-dependent oxidoreductase [Parabacteroides sp. Marseille-P3160]